MIYDIFGVSGIEWLKSLLPKVSSIDRIILILTTSIESIQKINQQIDTVSKEISKYACSNIRCKDSSEYNWNRYIFAAMLISAEIVNIERFSTQWKLVSYAAGLAPSTRESSGKTITGRITKQGSPWLGWILVQCALVAIKYDSRLLWLYH